MPTEKLKVQMATLTGGEARELYARNPVILLPMGSQEDQGPHMVMGDYLLADKIACLIAERASAEGARTVVAPVLPFGGADWFGPMPGGIALTPATLTSVIGDMIADLHRNKLTRILIVNGHSGNAKPIADVTRTLYRDHGHFVPCISIWKIAYAVLPDLIGKDAMAKRASHGSDPLTSVGLHLFPEFVRRDLLPSAVSPPKNDPVLDLPFTDLGVVNFEGTGIDVPNAYDDVYTNGVGRGDPRLGSAETGAALVERISQIGARFVVHFAKKRGA